MHIHQPGIAGGLGIAVSHADRDHFLQGEDIAEIGREIAKHR
jgi:hypothetical protein